MRRHIPLLVGLLAFCACGSETIDPWPTFRGVGVSVLMFLSWGLGNMRAIRDIESGIVTTEESAMLARLVRRSIERVKAKGPSGGLLRLILPWLLAGLAVALVACAPTTPLDCDFDHEGSSGSSGGHTSFGAEGPVRSEGSSSGESSGNRGSSGGSSDSGSDGSSGGSSGSSEGSGDFTSDGPSDGSSGSGGCAIVMVMPGEVLCLCDGIVSDPDLCPECALLPCEPSACGIIGVQCSCDGLPAVDAFCE